MPDTGRGWVGDLARFAGLGIQFVVWVALFGTAGYFCDTWFDTEPFLLIFGCLAGAAGGMWEIVRTVSTDRELGTPDSERDDDDQG